MLGVLAMGLAVLIGVAGAIVAESLSAFGWAPGLGLGVTAVALIIVAYFMPRKTDKGAEEAARWRAFKTYLRDIEKYSDLEAQKEIWDRFLPYAIAFGVDKAYIRQFEGVNAPAPGWYIPGPSMYGPYRRGFFGLPYGAGRPACRTAAGMGDIGGGSMGGSLSDMSRGMGASLTAMSAGLGAMLTTASSTMTSRPSSSSSGWLERRRRLLRRRQLRRRWWWRRRRWLPLAGTADACLASLGHSSHRISPGPATWVLSGVSGAGDEFMDKRSRSWLAADELSGSD